MTTEVKILTRADASEAIRVMRGFIPTRQMLFVEKLMRGEEKQFFFEKMMELAEVVKTMPKTYEQDGKGDDAIAYLHYFSGGADWWITEKDMETPDEPGQHQAFGLVDLGMFENGFSLGYISIEELKQSAKVELDFHWTPKTIGEIKKKR